MPKREKKPNVQRIERTETDEANVMQEQASILRPGATIVGRIFVFLGRRVPPSDIVAKQSTDLVRQGAVQKPIAAELTSPGRESSSFLFRRV